MQAVVLAAGEGKRLRPLTKNRPKVMIPVGNKPILEYIIDSLAQVGIRDIVMVVGYREDSIISYFGDGSRWGVSIRYAKQSKRLGTAHALYQAKDYVKGNFLILPGDNIIDSLTIKDIVDKEINTILATYSDITSKYGSVIEDKGKIRVVEKKRGDEGGLIFTGIAKLSTDIFEIIKESMKNELYDLPDILNELENLKISITKGLWMDAIYPWDLLRLNFTVLRNIPRSVSGTVASANIIGNVYVGDGTKIGSGVFIKGPAYIGENCVIGENSVIMPGTCVGDNVTIGAFSYLENSIIMKGSSLGKYSLIQNSIIGEGCSVGDRFTSLTGRFQKIINCEIIHRENFGVVMGDDCKIGAMVTTAPGILIGNNAKIKGMKYITEDICEEESVV